MIGALSSEWLKLRSVRSTYLAGGAAGAIVLFATWNAWAGGQRWEAATAAERAAMPTLPPLEQTLLPAVQLCAAVLGILAMTSVYTTGMIRTSLLAAPRRHVLLAAKATTVAATAFVAGQATVLAIHLAARLMRGDQPYAGYSSPLVDALPALLALSVSAMAAAVLGLALGVVLRSTAGAVVGAAVLFYVLPTFALLLPSPWNERGSSVMLPTLARELAGSEVGNPMYTGILSPPWALAVLAAYVALPLGAAAVLIHRKDA